MTGTVFDLQRFSIHDGPGIRTTVFLKGCPLRCAWCHNPESYTRARQIRFSPTLCVFCGACVTRCPQDAHVMTESAHQILWDRCARCFACAEGCDTRALEVVGREMSVAEVLAVVLRDRPFYEQSGGGVTLSGGEPFLQPAFTRELLTEAKREGIHTAVETCGFGRPADFAAAASLVDLFLFDIKETDPGRHLRFTTRELEPILTNLRHLDASGAAIVLRCPLVPGYNLRDDHLEGIAALSRSLKGCRAVELMGYHGMGASKMEQLGMETDGRVPPGTPDMEDAQIERALETLKHLGAVSPRRR